MIIDCISDLHGHYPELEGGDLLIIAGDLTRNRHASEYTKFYEWCLQQKYTKIIIIAGNHDRLLVDIPSFFKILCSKIEYLDDSGTEFQGLKIWGSPWTLWFEGENPNCCNFTVKDEIELKKKWDLIPNDTDILVTHMPPLGIRDNRPITREEQRNNLSPIDIGFGSSSLHDKINEIALKKTKPLIHVFGHIHEGYGRMDLSDWNLDRRILCCINASHVNQLYKPVNKPIRIEL